MRPSMVTFLSTFAVCLTVLGCVYWLGAIVFAIRAMRSMRSIAELDAPAPADGWPKVSIVIPACNEADTLEAAMEAKLREDYPNLELVLIDDRSTDGTGAIVDRVGAKDARVRTLRIAELPEGWLGKVNALELGYRASTGDWVLFSDADVHLAPGTLKKTIAWCEHRALDHLSVLPELWSSTFMLDVVLCTFVRIMCIFGRTWAVEDPRSKAAVGSGCFNLVRRTAMENSPGFEAIKLDVADDAALGLILKQSGARTAVVNGRDYIGLYFYRSLADMARGSEKNGFAVFAQFSVLRMFLQGGLLLWLELAPFLALLAFEARWLRILGAVTAAGALAITAVMSRWAKRPILPALLQPIASVLIIAFLVRSGILAVLRGGIVWRGTHYPTAVLREGARFKFP